MKLTLKQDMKFYPEEFIVPNTMMKFSGLEVVGLRGGNRSILKVSNSLYFSKMNHILQYRDLRYHLLMMIALFYILIRPQNYRNQRQKWRLLITLKELETLGRDL